VVALVGGAVPDGSGLFALVGVIWVCSGLVADEDGVGEECGLLD